MAKTLRTLFFALLSCAISNMAATPRIAEISTETDEFSKIEIICDSSCQVVRYAADELQLYLGKVTGQKPLIAKQPSDGTLQFILGDGPLSRAAGFDVSALPNEGYYIRRIGNRVYLLGLDDPKSNLRSDRIVKNDDRATLNAVYDFLERFLGVRFYFPHECGTIIPTQERLRLPKSFNILERPDLSSRMWGINTWGKVWEGDDNLQCDIRSQLQLRYRAKPYGQSNAINYFQNIDRFAKTHPEYFALKEDGTRFNAPNIKFTGQLCYTSGIVEEMYQDVKAYLTGQPASSRGMKFWNRNAFSPGYVNICPVDAFYWCGCEKCRQIARPYREFYKDPAEIQKVSDFIWQLTADMANRMKAEGVPGKLIQLAYAPYNLPPKCEIPDNVQVAVAVFPGIAPPDNPRFLKNEEQIAPWLKIVKGGVILRAWTGKTMQRAIPFIPAMKHNYIGQYFAERRHRYVGAFIDEYSDYFMFAYLNLYLFSKMAWNQELDPKAVLDEHFRLMFGKAAPSMRRFYDDLERLWNYKILSTVEDSGLGGSFHVPDEIEIWTNIYSAAKMEEYNALFDEAEKITTGAELQRVQFIRRELFGKLLEGHRFHVEKHYSMADWKIRPGETVYLRPHRGTFNEVQTTVKLEETPDSFVFRFHCDEPFMEEVKADIVQNDSPHIFDESEVELFLKPRADSLRYFQIAANPNGATTSYEYPDQKFAKAQHCDSGVRCTASRQTDAWDASLEVPKKLLGDYDKTGFKINLCRRRVFSSGRLVKEEYYKWCPYIGGTFHKMDNWGRIALNDASDGNLLKNPSLVGEPSSPTSFMGWQVSYGKGNHEGQKVEVDRKYFITQGQSLHLVNTEGNQLAVMQRVKDLKPDTRYALSFYVRTKDVVARRESLFSGVYVTKNVNLHLPATYINGTHEWNRMAFEFKTPKEEELNSTAPFGILFRAPGEVWFDEMTLKEIKD